MSLSEYEAKSKAEREARAAYVRRTAELDKIIRPLRTARYQIDMEWRDLEDGLARYDRDWGGLDLNPDFQRGHVWTPDQQRGYIESVLRGTVSSSGFVIQLNCPHWEDDVYEGDLPPGMQCIDGLQRITAVLRFMHGEVRPFGLGVRDLDRSSYMVKSHYCFKVAVHNFGFRADLLQHYLDFNAGGTPHSQAEIARVRQLREACLPSERAEAGERCRTGQ